MAWWGFALRPARVPSERTLLGWTIDFGCCDIDPGIRRTFMDKIAAMRHLFCRCDEVLLDLGDAHRCFDVLCAESFASSLRETCQRDPSALGVNTRDDCEMGAAMWLQDSACAQTEQTRILGRSQAAFADYNIILSPTTRVSPFR